MYINKLYIDDGALLCLRQTGITFFYRKESNQRKSVFKHYFGFVARQQACERGGDWCKILCNQLPA